MAQKQKTAYACPHCGAFLERQHWGYDQEKLAFQDILTCEDPKCDYYKLVKCECKFT